MKECPELKADYTGEIEHDLSVDGDNLETSGICRSRHNALVRRLKEIDSGGE